VHDPKSPKRFVTAPVSHQKQPEQAKTNTIEIERKVKSTKLIDILPLITVWSQLRVLPRRLFARGPLALLLAPTT
jgi:hypothetical protein